MSLYVSRLISSRVDWELWWVYTRYTRKHKHEIVSSEKRRSSKIVCLLPMVLIGHMVKQHHQKQQQKNKKKKHTHKTLTTKQKTAIIHASTVVMIITPMSICWLFSSLLLCLCAHFFVFPFLLSVKLWYVR